MWRQIKFPGSRKVGKSQRQSFVQTTIDIALLFWVLTVKNGKKKEPFQSW